MAKNKYNISEKTMLELFGDRVKSFNDEQLNRLLLCILHTTNHSTEEFLCYLHDPEKYCWDGQEHMMIGKIVQVDITNLWSSEKEYYEKEGLIIQDKWFNAKIIGFNHLKGDAVTIEHVNEKEKLSQKEIYPSYISEDILL